MTDDRFGPKRSVAAHDRTLRLESAPELERLVPFESTGRFETATRSSAPPHASLEQALAESHEISVVRADPLIGRIVADRYRILDPIGRGGMGIVYKVEHIRIGKLLAMKLLTGELSQNPIVVKRFKHEALTASKLSSPNTVQVFDFGVSDGLTYLVMELVTGDDLGRMFRSVPNIPAHRLGRIVIQICNALGESHHLGIVHRDIKPENVMITQAANEADFVKVLDFGLAKLREGAELNELTSQGAIMGTPYFMSPEQVRGDAVDPRSDIYSLGAVMYRGLTGHYPFNGPTPMVVFAKHLTETPPSPTERAPQANIPDGISAIVMRALRKDASERFQTVEELQGAIVEELSALGASGIDALLDARALQRLADKTSVRAEVPAPLATRDEVESYERKLRRTRLAGYAVLFCIPLAAASVAYPLLRKQAHAFSGHEVEPNDQPSSATRVPFAATVRGMLGKRVSPTQSDIDVFAIEVPSGTKEVALRTTSLPNIPLCTKIFRAGGGEPIAQFCPGQPGIDLEVSRLELSPGNYLLTVVQDMNPYSEHTPPVLENVSDGYSLWLGPPQTEVPSEVEPNDATTSGTTIATGQTLIGTFGWTRDVDVFCVAPGSRGRFRLVDSPRAHGVVLTATLIVSGIERPPMRIHTSPPRTPIVAGSKAAVRSPSIDATSPYLGFAVNTDEPTCVALKLTLDPTIDAQQRTLTVPRGSAVNYQVSLEESDP